MSEKTNKQDESPSAEKTTSGPTIKIAPAGGHQSRDGADPGPGDISAAPSEAPQLVELPAPPPPSRSAGGSALSIRQTTSGASKTTTSVQQAAASPEQSESPVSTPDSARSTTQETAAAAAAAGTSSADEGAPAEIRAKKKGKKKVAKFRYHKRISVSTHGKTNPSTIMDKVNAKDHKAGITVDKLDPQELMRRAGIDGKEGTHWRIRLRQTKRTTKNGKTITETRVAYRDSEGKSSVKTIEGEMCKKCNKKMEDCSCE